MNVDFDYELETEARPARQNYTERAAGDYANSTGGYPALDPRFANASAPDYSSALGSQTKWPSPARDDTPRYPKYTDFLKSGITGIANNPNTASAKANKKKATFRI